MKKALIIAVIVVSYLLFLVYLLGTEDIGAHHGTESMAKIVEHHITDHPIVKVKKKSDHGHHGEIHGDPHSTEAGHGDAHVNPVVGLTIAINNSIAGLNDKLKNVKVKLGPLEGDMRITKWVIMLSKGSRCLLCMPMMKTV